jgi:DNA gyrase subunit A
MGLISTKFKNVNSRLSSICVVVDEDELMFASQQGVVVRLRAGDISQQGRMATGVRIMNMDASDSVSSVSKIALPSDDADTAEA